MSAINIESEVRVLAVVLNKPRLHCGIRKQRLTNKTLER
jgi:hypothetical protein